MAECERKQFPRESGHLRPPQTAACVVCMDDLFNGSGDKVTRLPCFHYFHRGCIKQWLSCNGTCPICRRAASKQLYAVTRYGGLVTTGHARVSHVCYRRPRGLWVYQLMELIDALFFKGGE